MKILATMKATFFVALTCPFAYAAVDADAAKTFAKANDCFKCHAIDKSKKGPSFRQVAEKYRGHADAGNKVIKHLTTGVKVKMEDGSEEEHKSVEGKDPKALKNLADWLLAQ